MPAPQDQRGGIVKAASWGPSFVGACTGASPPCMSVHGQPELGYHAAYVVFDLNPPQGANGLCISYVSYVNPDSYVLGPWHQVGVLCGPSGGPMPQLGAN